MTYKVQLPVFEGPLDLLLYLIKKDEINIYDIPIAKITDQYLEYLEVMKLLDLEIAGEFILMAATLMHIKSKMLLPAEPKEEETPEEVDPREELVKKLIEYKKFKEVAGELKQLQLQRRDAFTRPPADEVKPEGEGSYFEASLFDLITAFSKVLKEVPKSAFHQVIKDEFTVSDKIHQILHMLVDKSKMFFSELFRGTRTRDEVVTIFLALLELVKLKEIIVIQKLAFDEIEIVRSPDWQKN
ncbi:MAG: segregation/condensation protein A [Candidatus Omnitrophica bacterium]|nr:segregation/condensation protein A [Candidatus Omnitrophota bacterium]